MQISYKNKQYLNSAGLSGALHARRHIHRVAPDVVVRLPGANHTGRYRPVIDSHLEYEMIEGLLVDALQSILEFKRKIDE